MKNSVLSIYIFVVSLTFSCAQDLKNEVNSPKKSAFEPVLLVDELEIPWGFVVLDDEQLLITEKSGKLILFKDGKKSNISNLPAIYNRGQGGLLDIATHPNFKENGWIYLSYASPEGDEKGGHTAIMRVKIKDGSLVNKELLYKAGPNTTKGQHFGSRIVFDNDGFLYFSIGERGARDVNPQDVTKDGGKVYRLHDDGRVPNDNPFVNVEGAKTAIYSYGHRNPQGLIKHPKTGEIWDHEHGPKGGDEINIVKKGANYGWPVITYGINYSGTPITDKTAQDGMEQPIHYWVPSIAPSGMAYISSSKYEGWEGSILAGSLAFQYLERLEMDGNQVTNREKLMDGIGRVRDVRQGPNGFVYVAVEGKGIYKLIPKSE